MPIETQRGLAGEPEDDHSRYIEAEVRGVRIAGIYLPNGNPQPGPKFDYKLRWMERLRARMAELKALEIPPSSRAISTSSPPMPTSGTPRRWPMTR
jgi:exodeoxyribonuclease-3